MIKFTQVSPDGKQVVFEAFGKLYVKSLPSGSPKRLTNWDDDVRELHPSWSRNSKVLVFASWNDDKLGALHIRDIESGDTYKVTKQPGHYRYPAFSPSG